MPYETPVPFSAGSESCAGLRTAVCAPVPDGSPLAFAEGRADASDGTGAGGPWRAAYGAGPVHAVRSGPARDHLHGCE